MRSIIPDAPEVNCFVETDGSKWHRHMYEPKPLAALPGDYGPATFQFCRICGCVPTTFLGKTP